MSIDTEFRTCIFIKYFTQSFDEKYYSISTEEVIQSTKKSSLKWLNGINSEDNIKEEAKEIFISLVNQYFAKEIVQKIEY